LQTPSSAGYGFGASITESGLLLLPLSAAMFIFGSLSSRFAARYGAKQVLLVGSIITIGTFVLLTVAHDHLWEILLAMAIQGMGFGLAYAAMSALVVQAVPAEQTGVASGMNTNIRTIGGAIGAAVMSSIVTSGVHPGGLPHESGYTHGFGLLAIAAVGAAVAAFFVPAISRMRSPEPPEKTLPHAELGILAGGTLVGYESE
jgi:MFS family permease